MLSSKISTVASSLTACHPRVNIWQQLQRFSLSSAYQFEDFIDKAFAKAQRDLDTDTLDDPGSLLRKLERDQRWRIRATKRAHTARLFRTPNEPRSLTRDTIEQIRYLKQEHGDEWTTKRLAASFDVTEALVIKVLKSKFVPSEKQLKKQDERAKVNAGLLPEKTATATRQTGDRKALLLAFSEASPANIVTPVVKTPIFNAKTSKGMPFSRREPFRHDQPQTISGQRSVGKSPKKEEPTIRQTKPYSGNQTPDVQARQHRHLAVDGSGTSNLSTSDNLNFLHRTAKSSDAKFRKSYAARRPNHIRVEENIAPDVDGTKDEEELNIDMENLDSYDDGIPPPQITREGNDFFDENGKFLYRV